MTEKDRCARPGCLGHMRPGKAIAQTYTGAPDFLGGEVVTMSPGGPGALVDCMKCDACGWSVTVAAGDGASASRGPLGQLPDYIRDELPDDLAAQRVEAWAAGLVAAERERCQPDGLKFDAFGKPRTRYVRVTLDGNHCVMHPSEGDRYLADARANGDDSPYVVADVWLSEREFDDLPEHDGF